MSRTEFSKPVKRTALERSGMLCEAMGFLYGLETDTRCNAPLGYGVEFDHILASSNGGSVELENCAAVCIRCHKHKTAKHDTPRAAKTVRQRDKALGIKSKHKWPSRPFRRETR